MHPHNRVAFAALWAIGSGLSQSLLSQTGNITLFDGISCTTAVFINSFILGFDHCGNLLEASSVKPSADEFQSLIVNERPFCNNGSRPYFNIYRDEGCSSLARSLEPGPLHNPSGPGADGTCVGCRQGFKALAFVCDGVKDASTSTGAGGTGAANRPSTATTEEAPSSTSGEPTLFAQTTFPELTDVSTTSISGGIVVGGHSATQTVSVGGATALPSTKPSTSAAAGTGEISQTTSSVPSTSIISGVGASQRGMNPRYAIVLGMALVMA